MARIEFEGFRYPEGIVRLEYEEKHTAFWDVMSRVVLQMNEKLTDENLKQINCVTHDDFPDQYLIEYKTKLIGLVHFTEDMFSKFIIFDSNLLTFIKI